MKIKYLIDTILTPKISVLDFVDRYAGIVRTINIAEGNGTETGIVKRYPVACNVTGADCANIGIYQNLVPDDTKKSIVYWEMIQPMSNVGYTSTRNFFEKRFRGTARLVVWLNLAKLGIENCTDAVNIIPILEKEITTRGKIIGGIFDGAQLRIQPLRMVNQEINTVFGKYDYNKLKNFYLYPFDFFAIDVQFTLEQCLDKGGTFPVLPEADCENQIPSEVVCKSLSFDGVNEYIDCTNNSAFSFNEGNAFSLETWVKFDNLTGFRFVISKWLRATPTDIRGYYFATNGNKLIFSFFSSNSTLIQAENTNILSIGQWYHLVCTYDGSSDANGIKLYINNVENSTILVNSLSGVSTNNIPLQIGGQDTFYTAGQIAKARVWNVELTASDVNTQYNGGTIQTSPVESGNLVVDTDINNAVFGTQFNIPDLTGITGGYTSVNMEDGDLLNECPE
jgi:hypothetical protein